MPNIRQGLGQAILELNGMSRSMLPDFALKAIAKSIDKDEWIIVGVGSNRPVDCTGETISFSQPHFESVSRIEAVESAVNTLGEEEPSIRTTESQPAEEPLTAPESERIVERADEEAKSEFFVPGEFPDIAVALTDDATCCQLIKSATSPYARPVTKQIQYTAQASVPGANVKIEARGRRNAAVLEPDHTRNCPKKCSDDEMLVPVSIDWDVSLHISGWIELGEHPNLATRGTSPGTATLNFGPKIGEQGELHIGLEGADVTSFKIGFNFTVRVADGIVLDFKFNCRSGEYLGIPELQHSDESGTSGSTGEPLGLAPPVPSPSSVQCIAKCYLAGAAVPRPPVNSRWTFKFTFPVGSPVTLYAITDSAGNFIFFQTRPPRAPQLPLPYVLFEDKIADTCGKQNFKYKIEVTRSGGGSPAPGSAEDTVEVGCPEKTPDEHVRVLAVAVGGSNVEMKFAVFSQCKNAS